MGFFFCVHRHTAQCYFLYNFFVLNLPILVVEGKLKLPLPFLCLYDFLFSWGLWCSWGKVVQGGPSFGLGFTLELH